jgi:hypothetical protein
VEELPAFGLLFTFAWPAACTAGPTVGTSTKEAAVNRRHAAVIALFLALALVAGLFAAVRTTRLGATSAASAAPTQIAAKNRQLDRLETKLRLAAKKRPPALPALPAAASRPVMAAAQPRTVYVRPAPIVRVVPRHGESEHELEHESEHGGEIDD